MARARLEATVGLRTGAFRRGVARLTRFARNAGRRIAGAFRIGRNIFVGAIAGFAAVAAAGAKAVKTFINQRAELAKLAAVQKATGFASGFTTGELDDQARALSKLTGISKEAINRTQAVLATFKNVSGKEFEQATAAILDMSVVLDQDAKQGAIQLGKALNDPIAGITALSRVGVTFTQQQKDQIRTLAEAGRMQAAQAIILKELQTEFGGAAAAVNEVDGGLANLQESFAQAVGRFGEAIATSDSFKSAVEALTDAIDNLVESGQLQLWAENSINAIKAMIPFAEKLRDMFGKITGGIRKAAAFAGAFSGHTGTIKERFEAGKKAFQSVDADTAKANQKRIKEIVEERKQKRLSADKAERDQMAAAPRPAFQAPPGKERFSSLRRIGANIIKGAAGGGQDVQKKQLSVLEQIKKEQKEMTRALKDRARVRGVF
jgi:hypothetical protein